MRVLVTGGTGFVGRWLIEELAAHGHEPVSTAPVEQTDLGDPRAALTAVRQARPDVIAHLAAVAFGPAATADPATAVRANIGATAAVVEAALVEGSVPVMVVSTAEVYGVGPATEMPLKETSPLLPRGTYGLTKLAGESIALSAASQRGLPVVVTRSFNHVGPGQRSEFAIPAFARRILEARATGQRTIRVGNIDVRRDILDVRDVVVAYRQLLELLHAGRVGPTGLVVNVASGTAVRLGDVITELATYAGHMIEPVVDPNLVRDDDPGVIIGDAGRLAALTGWRPRRALSDSLLDVLRAEEATDAQRGAPG